MNSMPDTSRDTPRGKEISLGITDINNLGCGVGRFGGVVVFVRGAVTGDMIKCKIIKENKSYLVGKLTEIVSPSPHRITEGVCTAPESCGGCVYRHIDYAYELELKRGMVREAFRRAGLADVAVGEVRSTGKITGYRNKAQYPVARTPDGGLCAGLYASRSHRLAGSADCSLQPDIFADIAVGVCRLAAERGVTAYDETTGRGLLRHIYLRRADKTGQITVCPVINGDTLPGQDGFALALRAEFPEITGVLLNINKENTNVVLGERFVTLSGCDYIEDELCGLRFRIKPDAFYQVNRDGAELLYSIAARLAGSGGDLLDLFCGAGTIGLTMADRFERVIGIEIVRSAVECARENAALNNIGNAYFVCGDAGETCDLLGAAERELGGRITPGTVILDPPRRGCTPELVEYIAGRGLRRVVYVSCDCVTLARDCALFARLGYSVGEVTPVDMFPRTGHVESAVALEKR